MASKHCGDFITAPIASLINKSIETGIFPDDLKIASVIPIHKGGGKDDVNNYRPISILPTLSKIFERYIVTELQLFLHKTNVIHNTQSGFRRNHSCHTALTRLIDSWLKDLDNGKYVGAVFLDLKKAFDLVDHQILMHKLKLYHFSDKTLKLCGSYLSNRRQCVKIGIHESETLSISSGVPQGSILGPVLFLIYINDLAYASNNMNVDLYADDSTLHESGFDLTSVENSLQIKLYDVNKWCKNNNMAINPTKTTCMIIGSKYRLKNKPTLNLKIQNDCIRNVEVQKMLGLYIDNVLSWDAHTNYVCKK